MELTHCIAEPTFRPPFANIAGKEKERERKDVCIKRENEEGEERGIMKALHFVSRKQQSRSVEK